MRNPFSVSHMKCEKCGKVRKTYPDFESQWTAVQVEGSRKFHYFCPTCWGIGDPASAYCHYNGHDFVNGVCMRCGKSYDIHNPDEL